MDKPGPSGQQSPVIPSVPLPIDLSSSRIIDVIGNAVVTLTRKSLNADVRPGLATVIGGSVEHADESDISGFGNADTVGIQLVFNNSQDIADYSNDSNVIVDPIVEADSWARIGRFVIPDKFFEEGINKLESVRLSVDLTGKGTDRCYFNWAFNNES